MKRIHNRMPVILHGESYTAWIDSDFDDTDILWDMLRPYPPFAMETYKVSRIVNSPAKTLRSVWSRFSVLHEHCNPQNSLLKNAIT